MNTALPAQPALDLGAEGVPRWLRTAADVEYLLRFLGYRHEGPDTSTRHLWVDPTLPITVATSPGPKGPYLVHVTLAGSIWSTHSHREHPISAHLLATAIAEARDYVREVLR